jgi:formate dehydrogenase iron-sulfur subunit
MMEENDMTKNNPQGAGISRRDFIGGLGAALGGVCILGAMDTTVVSAAGKKRAILYNSTKCVGCHYCEAACRNYNNLSGEVILDLKALPSSITRPLTYNNVKIESVPAVVDDDRDAERWLRVIQKEITLEDGETRNVFMRHSCTHCGLCVEVCPSGAIVKRDDGIVTMNPDKCIGCHYCYQACPFDIPRYRIEGVDKAMQKCIMCFDRVDEGKEPACVQACPMDALTFGDYEDMVYQGQEMVSYLKNLDYGDAYLYGEKELGGIGLMYVLPYSYDKYGLPDLPLKEQKAITWKDFVSPVGWGVGIAAVAALAYNGIKFIKNRKDNSDIKA